LVSYKWLMVTNEPKPALRRAMTAALKENRKDVILASALKLFCDKPFASITMNIIATDAGLGKGTLYLYFRTREEIFLALFTRELRSWLESFRAVADELASPDTALDWIAASLADRGELLRLGGLLHSVLELNLSMDAARTFKLDFDAALSGAASAFAFVLGLRDVNSGRLFLRWLQVCTVGIAQIAFPSSIVGAAIVAEPRLAHMQIDFKAELRRMLGALASGMQREEAKHDK
jgi:TetR/AcrR family transcriptional regulator